MSNQMNISLDKRRVEQIARLAELEGLKVAQWIDERVSAAWREAFPCEPIPGVRVWEDEGDVGRVVNISLWDDARTEAGELEFPAIVVAPDVAHKIAFGLQGVAEKEVSNFKLPVGTTGERIQIRRRGTGVTFWLTDDAGEVRASWASTPRMAVEVAECIARIALEAAQLMKKSPA